MQQIRPRQLAEWIADPARAQPLVLDVREPWEVEICRIEGALAMPMRTVPAQAGTLDDETPVVVICHHGMRSMQVAMFLEREGFTDVFNLQGGIEAWANDVDPAMARY